MKHSISLIAVLTAAIAGIGCSADDIASAENSTSARSVIYETDAVFAVKTERRFDCSDGLPDKIGSRDIYVTAIRNLCSGQDKEENGYKRVIYEFGTAGIEGECSAKAFAWYTPEKKLYEISFVTEGDYNHCDQIYTGKVTGTRDVQ